MKLPLYCIATMLCISLLSLPEPVVKAQNDATAQNNLSLREERSKLWYKHHGKRVFLLGTNYPWYNGYRSLDFGRLSGTRTISAVGMIGQRDLQQPPAAIRPGDTGFDAAGIEAQLADMASMNIRVLRWFFGGDGRSFMKFDAAGHCTGIDAETLKNVDTAVALAAKYHVFLAPCLLDFRFIAGDKFVRYADGKPAPFYASVIKDPAKRRLLIDKFIKPLAARYANSEAILYWEIMNECGNVVNGTDFATGFVMSGGTHTGPNKRVTPKQMQDFLNEAYDAIKSVDKRHPIMPSGLARPHQLPLIIGRVAADLYGAHYNDNGSDYRNIQSIAQLNKELKRYKVEIDKPLIMTEGSSTMGTHLADYMQAAYDGGWAGVLPWQYYKTVGLNDFIRYDRHVTSKDGNQRAKQNIEFYKRFANEHAEDVSLN